MKMKSLLVVPLVVLFGVTSAPTETRADPPSWAPAYGWHKQKNVDKRAAKAERRLEREDRSDDSTVTRLERENRELRRQNSLTQLDRQNRELRRQSSLTEIERQNREIRRQNEIARLQRENQFLREQRAFRP